MPSEHDNKRNRRAEVLRQNLERMPEIDRLDLEGNYCWAQDAEHFSCTKVKGHEGDHVAHGYLGEICARWPNAK